MSEQRSLIEAANSLRARGEPYLIATVVDVRGSSYRKPGARMLFTDERWLAGSISGGCLERDVVAKGSYRTRDGRPARITYDGATDERSGAGCDGIVDVLIERSRAGDDLTDPLVFAARCWRDETCGVLFTAFGSARSDVPLGARHAQLASGETASSFSPGPLRDELAACAVRALPAPSPSVSAIHLHGVDLLVELVVAPLHLFVFGGAHDALPVVTLAKALGFSVTVSEPHAQPSARERFRAADRYLVGPLEGAVAQLERCARPAALIMAHHYERDLAALEALLRSRVSYIGLLGAHKRAARMLADLSARGVVLDEPTRARLRAPVGLSIGAESPQEIALSIVAELQQHSAGRTPWAAPTLLFVAPSSAAGAVP